jgi:ComF family protein
VYFSSAISWAEYGGALREAIHALKYKSNIGLGDYFSRFLIDLLLEKRWDFDLVVPVPLSKSRMKERSYNQAALISRPVARYFRVDHATNALTRIKETGSQVTRSRIDRDSYLEDAFSGNPAKLKGRNVLLVDDIITTGSTINHCARALLEAGATQVKAISVAKTLKIRQNKDPMTIPFLDYPNSNGG